MAIFSQISGKECDTDTDRYPHLPANGILGYHGHASCFLASQFDTTVLRE